MPDHRRINSKYYYDLLPSPEHQCGDIWSGISSLGLLGTLPVSGIVVTPACDLARHKTETITILPIVALRKYFSLPAALPDVRRLVDGNLKAANLDLGFFWTGSPFRPPPQSTLAGAIASIDSHLGAGPRSKKDILALGRTKAGLRIAMAIQQAETSHVPASDLALAFNDWDKRKEQIIKNAYSSDLHFLPSDEQELAFSGLLHHSLVLFRYPLTIPIEVLDLAKDCASTNWHHVVDANKEHLPILAHHRDHLPVKTLRLKAEFLSDLLSRYVMVYNRIGSPDFTQASVARFSAEVDK